MVDDSFQRLLLELSAVAAQGGDLAALVREFCRAARAFFQTSGVYFWRLDSPEELVAAEADGYQAGQFRDLRLHLTDNAVAAQAVSGRRVLFVNDLDPALYPMAQQFQARSLLAAPLMVAGEVVGALAFLHKDEPQYFNDDLAAKATILAAQLGSLVEVARQNARAEQHRHRAESLMDLARELSPALALPQLLDRLAGRSASLVSARCAAVSLMEGGELRTACVHGGELDATLARRLAFALTKVAREHQAAFLSCPAGELMEPLLAAGLEWQQLVVLRLHGSNGDLLGLLSLADPAHPISDLDQQLLEAVARHASVALENALLFSRISSANRQWAEMFDAISDLILVHDGAFRITRVNRALADSVSVVPTQMIGIEVRAVAEMAGHPQPQACPFCQAGDASDESLHILMDRSYMVSTSHIPESAHAPAQTVHVLKDITDRTEAERRYRELFENVQEGIFFSTPEGRFVEVNDALVRMLGYASREELLQVDIPSELYCDPEERVRWKQQVESGARRGLELTVRRKDGSLINLLQNAFPVRDPEGHIVQYRGLVQDISGLKDFQTQLQRERDFNNNILNNTQNLILVTDAQGRITYANRRCYEALGRKEEELRNRPFLELADKSGEAELKQALASALAGERVDNLELPLAGPAGARLGQFSLNLGPMRDEQGHVTSLVAVMTDVTDAATLRDKLINAEKMAAVGQLVSGVAHEVNNPLTAILGFADLLLENPEIPDSAKKDLKLVLQEAQRTKLIVQNLLSFARQAPPQRNLVQLNLVLKRTMQLRSYDFSSRGIEVAESLAEPLPAVVGDPQQLQQVFLNILNNAYDAVRESSRRGRIEVTTRSQNGSVEVLFHNNGPAVTHPERIFDPFFTTKEVGKGTGLGLSICYGIVREHGGEISCQNEPHDQGVTFFVRLPVGTAEAALAAGVGQ